MKLFNWTKKQKITGIALISATASLAVSSFFLKKKIKKMKEEGAWDRIAFTRRLNRYLKAAKKDELTLDLINEVLEDLKHADLDVHTDKYLELQEYLDSYYEKIASSNHIPMLEKEEESLETRFKKCLNTQKYILENF